MTNIASNWWQDVKNLILISINLRNIMSRTRVGTNLLKHEPKGHILMYLYQVHINIVHSSIGLCNILELESKTSSNVKKVSYPSTIKKR